MKHTTPTRRAGLAVHGLLWAWVAAAQGQSPLPDGFNPGANDTVHSLAVQTDGKILIGGNFTLLGGQPRNRVARLNADGTLDPGFNPGADLTVYCIVAESDGRIMLGGGFSTVGGQRHRSLARLNRDGTLDAGFDLGAGGDFACVNSLAVQADGKILVGGWFTTLGGQPRNNIARLNADGTLDTVFAPGADKYVESLAVQADGSILVGGEFTKLGGQTRNRIGRLNADGTVDPDFDPGADKPVYSLVVQPDGAIVVGGQFMVLGGQPHNHLGRLNPDGTPDPGFSPSTDRYVDSLALQADGRLLVGGSFTVLDGQPRHFLARLNRDGTLDSGFDPQPGSWVCSLAVQADGKILVGGGFGTLGGQRRDHLARLNNTEAATQNLAYDGSTVTWLRGGTSPEIWGVTFDYSADGANWDSLGNGSRISGGWQLAGVFLPPDGTIRARGLVIDGYCNASAWFLETMIGAPGISSQPYSVISHGGDNVAFSVIAGGTGPLSYQWWKDGVIVQDAAKTAGATTATLTVGNVLKADEGGYSVVVSSAEGNVTSAAATLTVIEPAITSQPVSQRGDLGQGATLAVTAAATPPVQYQWWKDGLALAQGTEATLTFTNLQAGDAGWYTVVVSNPFGSVTSTVALVTVNAATLDQRFNPAPDSYVYALAEQVDGKTLVGGTFRWLGGQPRQGIARLNADGTLDQDFAPEAEGTYPYVFSLAVQADGRILAGGDFTSLGGQTRNRIARLAPDGALDSGFDPGANGTVVSLVPQADRKILVGGRFTRLGGQTRNYLARLNADGTMDLGFNPQAGGCVLALAVQADGKVLVGGEFDALGGQWRNHLARLNADGTLDTGFDPWPDGYVLSLAVQADGKVLVGGRFTVLGGQRRNYLGRLNADGTLDPAFNPGADGSVASLAVQADGKILLGGEFTSLGGQPRRYVARLNADGALDPLFGPSVDFHVASLALQADGRVLLGGYFATVGWQPRNRLARLNAAEPATQSLAWDGSTVTWLGGGASPEVCRTTFEHSTDGVVWTRLGDGSRIAGGWQLTGVSPAPGGTTRARGQVTGGQFNGSSWWLESMTGAPCFVTQPSRRTNGAGSTATFTVLPAGTGPFSYQWRKDGVALVDGAHIAGAMTATLSVSGVLKPDEGAYSVVIANAEGSVTSATALLTVVDPLITTQPTSQSRNAGDSSVFSVAADGTLPTSYQWWKDGLSLADGGQVSGAAAATLTLSNLLGGNAGTYWVVASNVWGSATSAVAVLAVQDPYITVQPVGQLRLPGESTVLSVTAIGTPPLDCQWQLNGTNVPGANSVTLALHDLQLGDLGDYRALIRNAYGSVTSTVANLTYEPLAYWSRFDSGPGEDLFAVTFSPAELFVAAGYEGAILTSLDGVTWARHSLDPTDYFHGITWGQDRFVAVGQEGMVRSSPDGTNWAHQVSGTDVYLKGIAYGNSTFVAVGEGGTIVVSSDATNWVSAPSGTALSLNSVCFGNGLFVAVGHHLKSSPERPAVILVSTNGVDWVSGTNGVYKHLRGVAAGPNRFVAVGNDGTILTSTNGFAWTPAAPSGCLANIRAVTYANGNYVAVGNAGVILSSTDGIFWKARNPVSAQNLHSVDFGKGAFVAVGNANTIIRSGIVPAIYARHRADTETVQLVINGESGVPFCLQSSGDLRTWIDLRTWTNSTIPSFFEDPRAGNWAWRFYRLRILED